MSGIVEAFPGKPKKNQTPSPAICGKLTKAGTICLKPRNHNRKCG